MIPDLHDPLAGVQAAVRATGLTKRYGRRAALDGLDLTVPDGAVYILVGSNGAGKTTLLRTLLDLARAEAGEARVFGLSPTADGPRVRARIGYLPESPTLPFGTYRVDQMIGHHAAYFPNWDGDYARELSRALDIQTGARCDTLSKGESRRVQLVLALAHRPDLLLLDEPTDGLDPLARDRVMELLVDHLATHPTTMLISTHQVNEVEGLGDHLGVLRDGRLIAQAQVETLTQRLLSIRGEVRLEQAKPPFPVLRHRLRGREGSWILWTDGAEVEARLAAAGITVQLVEPLSLEGAARALLAMEAQ